MELIISILCLLLGGAYCEDQGAGTRRAQPTAVATAGPQPTAIPTVPVDPYTPENPNCNYAHYPTVLSSMAISPGGGASRGPAGPRRTTQRPIWPTWKAARTAPAMILYGGMATGRPMAIT